MKQLLTLVFAGLLAFPAGAAETAEGPSDSLIMTADQVNLNEFLWIKRLVVVFADTPNDPRFIEQMALIDEDTEALEIRDFIVITDTDPSEDTDIRRKLRPRDFSLVLIDKDGGVKLRKPDTTSLREIRRSVDKWPTRQQEIRDRLGKE